MSLSALALSDWFNPSPWASPQGSSEDLTALDGHDLTGYLSTHSGSDDVTPITSGRVTPVSDDESVLNEAGSTLAAVRCVFAFFLTSLQSSTTVSGSALYTVVDDQGQLVLSYEGYVANKAPYGSGILTCHEGRFAVEGRGGEYEIQPLPVNAVQD